MADALASASFWGGIGGLNFPHACVTVEVPVVTAEEIPQSMNTEVVPGQHDVVRMDVAMNHPVVLVDVVQTGEERNRELDRSIHPSLAPTAPRTPCRRAPPTA